MDIKDYKNLWVFIEQENNVPKNVGLELIAAAKDLAKVCNQEVWAMVIGSDNAECIKAASEHGADKVVSVEGPEFEHYNAEAYCEAILALIEKHKPSCIMYGATFNGRDLAPRCACSIGGGLTADCTDLEIDEEGIVTWILPTLGGNLLGHIREPKVRPQMGTVRPGIYEILPAEAGRKVEVINEKISVPAEKINTKFVEFVQTVEEGAARIEDANILVCAGMGLGKAENIKLCEELADALGGQVVGTRPVVDNGWLPVSKQIGQTGKIVHPDIFICVGCSGAIQLTVGMDRSKTIIAINNDVDAPIFEIADYAIVGSLFDVVPELTAAVKAAKAE